MNLARHGVQANATVFPLAAYSRPCRMALITNEANRGDHVLAPHASSGLEVRCVRLDDVLPRSVDVIKIDTQGSTTMSSRACRRPSPGTRRWWSSPSCR